ncbi:MAG TPA: glycosyltransferase family 2 protein [Gemmataceae bacterium]|nr:glycosyltransferase family 2 protein [Gemmataceae bacterium]
MEATQLSMILFWTGTASVLYCYIGYPLIVWCLARCLGRPCRARAVADAELPDVSLLIVAHNEQALIGKRVESALTIDYPAEKLEIVVVCDGCTDATAATARAHPDQRVHVLELPNQVGKAAALTHGCAVARHAILVLADVRQSWDRESVKLLVENFADPAIGAVSGNLVLEQAPGVLAGVGLYWRFEKWLRGQESRLYSMVGLSGSISALRRELFRPIPQGTILDDVYWPLQVVLQGYRVVLDERARAYDRLPKSSRDEFRRKVRTLSGNFQLVGRLPAALLPWRNPVWFQYLSHKMLRLVVPWALLGMLITSWYLEGPGYRLAFWGQTAFYVAGLAGIRWKAMASGFRLVSVAASFLVLNAAAWLALWVWLSGKTSRSWVKVSYQPSLGSRKPAPALASTQQVEDPACVSGSLKAGAGRKQDPND